MSLSKETKDKTLAFKATETLHTEVVKFCEDRMWNMSKFLEKATVDAMNKVRTSEKSK